MMKMLMRFVVAICGAKHAGVPRKALAKPAAHTDFEFIRDDLI